MFRFAMVVLLAASATTLAAAEKDGAAGAQVSQAGNRKIGVVDVNHLFKIHVVLKRKLGELQIAAQLEQAKFESELKSLQSRTQKLKDLPFDSREYRKLDEETVREKARIQAEIALTRKDFVQREARCYLEVYREIKKDVESLAKRQHLSLVINANLDEIAPENPEDVARGISNKVVWFDDSVNLTPQLEGNYREAKLGK